jgi:hypothetical protein
MKVPANSAAEATSSLRHLLVNGEVVLAVWAPFVDSLGLCRGRTDRARRAILGQVPDNTGGREVMYGCLSQCCFKYYRGDAV